MALLLLLVLLTGYILIGVVANDYSKLTRAILLILTFAVPAGFYLLF